MSDEADELEIEVIPDEEATAYPHGTPLDERRRAWCLTLLCDTAEGPLFDSFIKHASDMEAFLLRGAVPSVDTNKHKPKIAGVK